jgi:hypothetical protein
MGRTNTVLWKAVDGDCGRGKALCIQSRASARSDCRSIFCMYLWYAQRRRSISIIVLTDSCAQRGSKTCSIIVKVHRRASQRTKLSSLYLFDAVCRHAADIVRKRGSGFAFKDAEAPSNSTAERGTQKALVESAASFLKSACEILEEMVMIAMESVKEEQRVRSELEVHLRAQH